MGFFSNRISGLPDGSDLIQPVCQIYETVVGERVHLRKTALVRLGSPLHPFSVCNPNCTGHERCLPLILEYVPAECAPPTMAHHFYYQHIRNAQISTSLKNDLYFELYHTAPNDLSTKYAHFRTRFNLKPPDECRSAMFSVMKFWSQHCKRLNQCLDVTEFFPVRLEWVDPVFEGTKFMPVVRSRNLGGGHKVDEYGWVIEMIRAERTHAFSEYCPLIFIGDDTSTRLARYIEWGKRLSPFDGRSKRRFENDRWKLENCERMTVLVHLLQKVHFGNGCVAVVLSTGSHELAEGMPPSSYAELLKLLLIYLLQFQLRIIVLPPTPCAKHRHLWFCYLKQQRELSTRMSAVEFLIMPSRQADDRSFLDALVMGNHTLDPHMCDDRGYTDFGIRKLGFFLIEVLQIPKMILGTEVSWCLKMEAKSRKEVVDFDRNSISKLEEHSLKLAEACGQDWFPPSLEYEPIDDISPLTSSEFPLKLQETGLLPSDIAYLDASSCSLLPGSLGVSNGNEASQKSAFSDVVKSRHHRKKKTRNDAGRAHIQPGCKEKNEQSEMMNVVHRSESFELLHVSPNNFFTTQERRVNHRQAHARLAAEQLCS